MKNRLLKKTRISKSLNSNPVMKGWLDSKGVINEWEYKEELEPLLPCQCLSIGFVVERTKEYTTIAQSVSETQILGRLTIPNCSINYIKNIKQN